MPYTITIAATDASSTRHEGRTRRRGSLASVVAEGETLWLTTVAGERHALSHPLKELELRLDPGKFVRLSRGTLVAVQQIEKVTPMTGGTFVVTLRGGARHAVSRQRGKGFREGLLRL